MASRNPSDVGYQSKGTTSTVTSRSAEVSRPSEGASRTADRVKVEVQERAGEVVEQAQERTKSMLDSRKGAAAASLGDVARMLQRTGEQMEQEDQASVAHYAYRAADTVERLSSVMRDRSVDEILDDVEAYARRQPEVVIGGALVLGFLASRFLKSSSARRSQTTGYRGYRAEPDRSSSYYLAGDWPRGQSRPMGAAGSPGVGASTYRTPAAMASRPEPSSSPTEASSATSQSPAQTGFGGCPEESE